MCCSMSHTVFMSFFNATGRKKNPQHTCLLINVTSLLFIAQLHCFAHWQKQIKLIQYHNWVILSKSMLSIRIYLSWGKSPCRGILVSVTATTIQSHSTHICYFSPTYCACLWRQHLPVNYSAQIVYREHTQVAGHKYYCTNTEICISKSCLWECSKSQSHQGESVVTCD